MMSFRKVSRPQTSSHGITATRSTTNQPLAYRSATVRQRGGRVSGARGGGGGGGGGARAGCRGWSQSLRWAWDRRCTLFERQHGIAIVDVAVDELHEHVEEEDGGEEDVERQGAIDPVRHLHRHGDGGVRYGDGHEQIERRDPPAAGVDDQAVEPLGPLQQYLRLVVVGLPCTPTHTARGGARRRSADILATPGCQSVQRAPDAPNTRLALRREAGRSGDANHEAA